MKTVKKVDFPANLQMSSSKELGLAVRSARTAAGFTLANAAQALGISKQTLSDLELGTGTVTLGLAFQVLNALGVSVFVAPAQENARVRRALKAVGLGA
jgi:transcriptional regulator with XRE-family HTH domain